MYLCLNFRPEHIGPEDEPAPGKVIVVAAGDSGAAGVPLPMPPPAMSVTAGGGAGSWFGGWESTGYDPDPFPEPVDGLATCVGYAPAGELGDESCGGFWAGGFWTGGFWPGLLDPVPDDGGKGTLEVGDEPSADVWVAPSEGGHGEGDESPIGELGEAATDVV